ncbi:F0F1 ATP synthase subunit A [Wielerella bovis]|uniref:F0F1 ATP synthase subunit A n=1 Tax=Wielerella bovis TaxID=2917790 RepID=UPI00201887C2|nr:F0F1 ATP synthase subunit A [Wielerella bovis]ULJ60697.1 F0F1 ATP synthase subunit A [Wielerella bovis]ULJ62889.1 F0F1 ATP synthase subunit A [Wielerella bovis]ULJ65119.1 F0F1 ATP synthase subunit A [Wielerella bovis]ULJ67393.1 F0F1 ATP synthase subunit A [Wielerella bovis]ULJ69696.1 F0F1 ATP synthase subunit A [Wielerella bovis]
MASEVLTPADYIKHHLQSLTSLSDVTEGQGLQNIADFSFINLDAIFFSALLGILGSYILYRGAQKATSGVPTRFQAAVEILFEFVDDMCKSIIHNEKSRKAVAPVGLTLFVWIFLMNAMDLLPVDLLPRVFQGMTGEHHALLRVVPTADLNTTLAIAIGVLLMCIYYSIKIKGLGGWGHELISAPFGANGAVAKIILMPINFVMNVLEFFSKTVSHGMRLFGNMYAGELVFLLIALLGGAWASTGSVSLLDPILFIFHILAGLAWAIFHILVITLQAFIFMALAFVYIGQAHEHH